MKHDQQAQPQYQLSDNELKILRAVWLKNAPMSYEEILGACVSDYWDARYARQSIDALMEKQLLERLDTGRYDALMTYEEFKQMTEPPKERRKRRFFSCADREEEKLPLAMYSCFEPATEYLLRYLERELERKKQELEREKQRREQEGRAARAE